MAAELEVLIELGFVVHTPIFEELVVLESEDRLAWGKCSAAAFDIPNGEDRDGIDAETLPKVFTKPLRSAPSVSECYRSPAACR